MPDPEQAGGTHTDLIDPQGRLAPQPRNRLVVIDLVHHVPADADAFTIESKFARNLETNEQPYLRINQIAEPDWKVVDLGWIQSPGTVLLVNEEGRRLQTNPTEAERSLLAGKILEVMLIPAYRQPREDDGVWEIPPGESMRGLPKPANQFMVRSRQGRIRYTVVALPR